MGEERLLDCQVKIRVLDPQEVENLEESSRTMRGGYLVQIQRFVESGEMGWDMSTAFPHKTPEAIRSSLNNNIEKHSKEMNWPRLKVMISRRDEHCALINLDVWAKFQGITPEEAEAAVEVLSIH